MSYPQDADLVEQVYAEAARQQNEGIPKVEVEYQQLLRRRQRNSEEVKRLVSVLADLDGPLASVTQRLRRAEVAVARLDARVAELQDRIALLRSRTIDAEHLREMLAQFAPSGMCGIARSRWRWCSRL
jgi:septal ring factor EnvC (AmiA/AmiB activator)